MNYYISDEVPEHWNGIIDSFITMAAWENEFNGSEAVDEVEFRVHKGLLQVAYFGGNYAVDAHSRFAREMSAKICFTCGVPATRVVFQYPKCENCD
jgi:hypothetical protein